MGGEVLLLSALCQPKYLKSFWPQYLFIYVILGSSYVHIRVLFSIEALWCKSDHHENMEIILLSTQDRIWGILLTYPEFHVADLHCTARLCVGHAWEHGNHLFCVTLGIGSPVKRQGQGCLAIPHFILGILLPLWLYLAMVAQVSSLMEPMNLLTGLCHVSGMLYWWTLKSSLPMTFSINRLNPSSPLPSYFSYS